MRSAGQWLNVGISAAIVLVTALLVRWLLGYLLNQLLVTKDVQLVPVSFLEDPYRALSETHDYYLYQVQDVSASAAAMAQARVWGILTQGSGVLVEAEVNEEVRLGTLYLGEEADPVDVEVECVLYDKDPTQGPGTQPYRVVAATHRNPAVVVTPVAD